MVLCWKDSDVQYDLYDSFLTKWNKYKDKQ
jgi:hypothetical protein